MSDMDDRERELNRQWRIRENETHRQAVIDWLNANGIDVKAVPIDAKASITDGMLTIPLKVKDAQGRDQIDPDRANSILLHTVTVPVVVPPTPEVELWLTPTCPTCGR